ncbi:MAG: YdcF family protein, partial [Sphingomonas bacterium]|nr:YdcF family protein [Sphingomonas bacterium]
MIVRFGSLLLIFYALGFLLFGVTLGTPAAADAAETDAIVVITGGTGRIEHAVEMIGQGKAKR